MFNSTSGLTASDVALLNRDNDSFGNGGSWFLWVIVILALFNGGWGNNGWNRNTGSGEGNSTSVYEGYVLQNDFSQLERKLDGIANGLCDSTFALNNTIINGNNGINQNITEARFGLGNTLTQGFAGLNTALVQQGYETRMGTQQLSSDMAQNCCGLNNTMNINTRDIVTNMNAGFQKLHDEIFANRMEDKNAQIQQLQMALGKSELAQSQCAQNAYLISQLKTPCPIPAYQVPSPYATVGCGCGCGCA